MLDESVGVYAGTGKSGLFRNGEFASVEREDLKSAVKTRAIRLGVVLASSLPPRCSRPAVSAMVNVPLGSVAPGLFNTRWGRNDPHP